MKTYIKAKCKKTCKVRQKTVIHREDKDENIMLRQPKPLV